MSCVDGSSVSGPSDCCLGGLVDPNGSKWTSGSQRDPNCQRFQIQPASALKPQRLEIAAISVAISTQELSGTPNPWYFLKSIAGTNGRRIVVQIGGILQYKLEMYCGVSLSPKLRSHRGTALQMGGVLRYKLQVYRQYFQTSCTGWGFLNSPHLRSFEFSNRFRGDSAAMLQSALRFQVARDLIAIWNCRDCDFPMWASKSASAKEIKMDHCGPFLEDPNLLK